MRHPFFIMLKNLVFILLWFFLSIGFQESEILSFEYLASTRGSYKKVIIRKDSTFVWDQDKKIKMITKKPDWVFLNEQITKIDLKKMELFKAPTEERYSDHFPGSIFFPKPEAHGWTINL